MNIEATKQISVREMSRQVTYNDLFNMLEANQQQIQILSLDCFDTLIWRKCARPIDVFYELQHAPLFKKLNFHPILRIHAEHKARQRKKVETGSTEVTLRDIYLTAYPYLTDDEIKTLSNEEIECEINYCFAYQPMVDLIEKAICANKKIIIVSDTYLVREQLNRILIACLPSAIVAAISQVFVSNESGISKSQGMFNQLLPLLDIPAETILHLGDHSIADYQIPLTSGVNAYHFIQYAEYIQQLMRMQNVMALFIDPSIRTERPLSNIYKLACTMAQPVSDLKPETCIGYYVLGPIMHAFSTYLIHEYNKLNKQYPKLKVAFLLRDGYLPWLASQALNGTELGTQIRISRFAAYAASFRSKDDIRNYVASVLSGGRYADICKQLLLQKSVADKLIKKTKQAKNPETYFSKEILKPSIVNEIITESKRYWGRLRKYLENSMQLTPGDTLLLVDLGYTCTTQQQLAPMLRDELNVTLLGRYLISLRTPNWEESRNGLIDASWCSDSTMHMIVGYIALLEQLCTTADRTVVDFDFSGNPVYAQVSVNSEQHDKLTKIQDECIRFMQTTTDYFSDFYENVNMRTLREAALSSLARLIFLPTSIEIDYLKTFKFDLNLGTDDTFSMLDPTLGLTGLRQRGLFFMEHCSKNMRTNYPAELRYAGIELSLTLIAQHRFNLEFSVGDLSLRKEKIQIIVINQQAVSQHTIEAQSTFDGYFALTIPLGNGNNHVGIMFGEKYKWLQIESIVLIPVFALYTDNESIHTTDATSLAMLDKITHRDGNLYECASELSVLILKSPPIQNDTHYVFKVVYRPIVGSAAKLA